MYTFAPEFSDVMKNRYWMIIAWLAGVCCSAGVMAQEKDSLGWTPEWGAEFTTELQLTHHGKANLANLLRLQACLPLGKGVSFSVGSISTCMTSRESIGKDMQTFSNLDAGNIPFALSTCGMGWESASCRAGGSREDNHSFFVGIRNMNEDYFASEVTTLFTNSSCGIFPTLSANFDIANYPLASIGAHYRYEKPLGSTESEEAPLLSLQASLYNGRGYHRFTGRDNVFRFCPHSDGLFALAEAHLEHQGSHYFLGSALHFQHGTRVSPWAYAEQFVTPRLSLIAAYSHAFGSDLFCSDFLGLGAHYHLSKARLGLFTDYARFSEAKEWATELTCKLSVTHHFSVQPSAHFILTDGTFTSALSLRLIAEI